MPASPASCVSTDLRAEVGSPSPSSAADLIPCVLLSAGEPSSTMAARTGPCSSPSKPRVHKFMCKRPSVYGGEAMHTFTAPVINSVGDMQQDSSHIHKFTGRFLSQFCLFFLSCLKICKQIFHPRTFKNQSVTCCH